MKTADIVIFGGTVYTVNPKGEIKDAMAVKGDRIVYVGNDQGIQEYIGPDTRIIDLKGGMALPGFIDCHTHPSAHIDPMYAINLFGLEGRKAYEARLRQYLKDNPDATFIYGFGWAYDKFGQEGPTKEMLDEISQEIPILLYDEGYHSVWVNSKALSKAGITAETCFDQPDIMRRANNEPTGIINELSILQVISIFPDYEISQYMACLEDFQRLVHPYGITSVFDACLYTKRGLPGFPGDHSYEAYQRCAREDNLLLRYAASIVIDQEDYTDDKSAEALMLKYKNGFQHEFFNMNAIKIYADYWTDDRLSDLGTIADRNGFQLFLHALSAEETKRAITVSRNVRDRNGQRDARHTIAHIGVVDREDIPHFKELNLNSVILPYWINCVEEFYGRTKEKLNAGDLDLTQSFIKAGVNVASGTAYPAVTDIPRPLNGIEMGMIRRNFANGNDCAPQPPACESATLDQMIRSFTINAAYANHLDRSTGSLEVGKKADIVLLDKDLRQLAADQIHTASETMTIFNGKIVYEK